LFLDGRFEELLHIFHLACEYVGDQVVRVVRYEVVWGLNEGI
jgi:hypothetical protein